MPLTWKNGRTRIKTGPGDAFPSKVQHRIVSDRTRDSPVRGWRTTASARNGVTSGGEIGGTRTNTSLHSDSTVGGI